jgi:hypothetical protein
MSIRIRSGRAQVIAGGQVTAFEGHPILIFLDDLQFAVGLRFVTDEGELRVDPTWVDDRLELVLYNFESAEGRGSAQPVRLAERGEQVLWLHFRTFKFGNTIDHTVHYCIYATPRDPGGIDA